MSEGGVLDTLDTTIQILRDRLHEYENILGIVYYEILLKDTTDGKLYDELTEKIQKILEERQCLK